MAQWEPYQRLDELGESNLPTAEEALRAVLKWNNGQGGIIRGLTRLLIVPGYPFQMYVNTSRARMMRYVISLTSSNRVWSEKLNADHFSVAATLKCVNRF